MTSDDINLLLDVAGQIDILWPDAAERLVKIANEQLNIISETQKCAIVKVRENKQ